jgi:LysR family hydrogen peroxide-inducible transcriptional activator
MELNLYRAFVAVAELRSFSRAAATLNVTQPALSRQIARLETELGTRLFERYGRHVECTSGGQFLLPLAEAIIARADEAVSLMRERAGAGSTTVRLGATGMVFAHFLTPILTAFITAHPSARLELMEADDVGLEEAVIDGKLDCAVCTPWKSTRAAAKHLLTEEIFLVVACDHQLASLPAVTFSMLAKENILLPPAPLNISSIISDAFGRAGVEPKISYRALYPELIKNLVRTGWGVAPMPSMLTSPEALGGLVAIPFEERLERELVLIYPWDRPLPAAARALMAHLQRQASLLAIRSTKHREPSDRSRRPRRAVDNKQP